MPVLGLPFDEVWVLDTEFTVRPGGLPETVCLVARELSTGTLIRLWMDDIPREPPFRMDDKALFVAYYASAEWSTFLSLGWGLPTRILDLYAEFRNQTNGHYLAGGRGLLGALSHHGLTSITKAEKAGMRERIIAGAPFSDAEREDILDYCQSDVDCLPALLERMLPHITSTSQGLGQALLRGRYTAAVARIERAGIPLDAPLLARLRDKWDDIKLDLITAVDRDFGVYEGASFRTHRFVEYLNRQRIGWPRTESGALSLESDTFRDMSKIHPQITPLKELRSSLGELRLMDLAVGPDGRNRVMLSQFGSKTGRNQPSNTKFIFGPSVWVRGLIVPPEGRAMAYLDWSAQEVAIAAVMSGDEVLRDAIRSGDPYIRFAILAGLVPPGSTKATHPKVREFCKVAVLGTNYGMGPHLLAHQTGLTLIQANDVLKRLQRTFPTYFKWSEDNINRAQLHGVSHTVFGWKLNTTAGAKPNSIRNFPMQGNGAEMLRLACCLVTEAGIDVAAPVHDALLIEADADEIDDAVEQTTELMAAASRAVLDGWEIPTEAKVVGPLERYSDPRGVVMWDRVMDLLGEEK